MKTVVYRLRKKQQLTVFVAEINNFLSMLRCSEAELVGNKIGTSQVIKHPVQLNPINQQMHFLLIKQTSQRQCMMLTKTYGNHGEREVPLKVAYKSVRGADNHQDFHIFNVSLFDVRCRKSGYFDTLRYLKQTYNFMNHNPAIINKNGDAIDKKI